MKRFLALLVVLTVILSGAINAVAANEVRVFVDDKEVQSQVSAYSEDGRTLVPVRALAEALGFTVGWDPAERRITLSKEGSTVVLWVDSTRVLVNGVEGTIDVPAKITNGSTFVPVRFVAEKLGSIVYWDAKANGARVYSPKGFYKAAGLTGPAADMKATYDIDMKTDMAGAGLPGGKLSTTISVHMDFQSYQGSALMTVTTKVPGVSNANSTQQLMVRDGKLFMQSPLTKTWTAVKNLDMSQGFNPTSVLSGVPDLSQMTGTLMNDTAVTLVGTEDLDGVKVVHLDLDLSKIDMQSLLNQMANSGTTSGQVDMKVDRMKFSTWVQPETQFVRKSSADMAYALTVTEKGETMTINMDLKLVMQAQPVSEPIDFGSVTGSGTGPSKEILQEAAAYWQNLKPVMTTDLKTCAAGGDDVLTLWSDEQDAAGKQKAGEVSACYAAAAKKLEPLTAPKGWENAHTNMVSALKASAQAYTTFAAAFDPNPETRQANQITGMQAIGDAGQALDLATSELNALVLKYKLN